jgi:hypothetical protein
LSAVVPEFLEQQARLVAALRAAEGLDLTRAKIASPFDRRVKYNIFAAFRIVETHERRHVLQAERAVSGG